VTVGLRHALRRRRGVLAAAAVLALVVAGNVAAYAHDPELDLSAGHRYTLSKETVALVREVHHPLHVIAFVAGGGLEARRAGYLLARYHELNRAITYSVVDPEADPGEARRYGITAYSTVVLTYEGRRVDAPLPDEEDISTAILRLLRGGVRDVCVMTGEGEPSLSDRGPDGLSGVAALLRHNAFRPVPLDLAVGDPSVPSRCAAVLDLGPEEPFLPATVQALLAYLRGGGRMMLLVSSLSGADPNPILEPYGMHFLGGLVLDPARSEGVDWSDVIVQKFPSVNPVDQGVSSMQLPAPSGLLVTEPQKGGLTVSTLAVTSHRSYLDPHPDRNGVAFGPGDIPGPITVAAAADESELLPTGEHRIPEVTGPRIQRTRLVVVGCDTFMTNGFLDHLGNRRFLVNAVDWLTEQNQLVVATSPPVQNRPLPLTPALQAEILGLTVGAVPACMIGTAVVWRWADRIRRGGGRRRR
jgi:ABC-type uncharacterized transport system involved in gliding motility auxiliary subunit